MASENVIQATFDGFYKIHTKPSWLIDHGMELSISGIDLPDEFECHFSNSRSVAAKRQIGENGVVTIPDEYFLSNAAQIFCWIYLHPTVDSGVTEYEIVIPLLTRPNVDPAEPTQEQQDIVDQAIAALNVAMTATSADVESASASATAAHAAQQAIENMAVSSTTLSAGSDATVTKTEHGGVVNLSFGIPQGDKGDAAGFGTVSATVDANTGTPSVEVTTSGPDTAKNIGFAFHNMKGDTGATPNFSIGTVTTGAAGSSASATITGTDEAPVLNLTIPRGDTGEVNAMSIASAYSSSATYAVGDYVFYNGVLYRCTSAITTAETWTAAHWTAAVLGDDVDALESKIPSMKDIESIAANGYKTFSHLPTGTKYNWSNTSTALSPDDKISNAYKLNKCALEIATAGTFKVGLYTASDTTATVTHAKEITAGSTGITEFDLDFLLDPTRVYYFFVLAVSGAFKFSAVTTTDKYFTIPSSAVSVGGTGTITTASGNGLALGTYNIFLNITVSGKGNTVTVAKSGGDYSTIQEAVNNTTTETIIVYPGIYDEVVTVPNSGGRNIIGVDREKCIIRSQSGKYADTPLKIYGDFYLANMTLIATADEAESWYPTWDSSDPTTFASYAIHIDGWTNDWNGAKGIVRNCTFYSECNHAAGCGIQKGYTLEFENCEFVRNVTDSNYLNSSYDGAMGVHSPNVDDTGATGEHLIMRDCTVVNKNQTKALQLFYVFVGAEMDAEIKGCTFKDSAGIDNVIKYRNCSNAMITDMSHGNSTDECNYRAIHA